MKFIKRWMNPDENPKKIEHNMSIKQHVSTRISHIRRKMSRGASDIYRMMKVHAKWGNKQLWGFREKGRNRHKPE
ncbi:MAG: hypothetical protein BWY54_00082 [Candidatus Dependentiae bacterium ADurb.Bin331]|nr:MAG: hypothetical protein BWY54_00082 [Candidatus Dependentiae bacterium ADurb.Bin331]